MKHVTGCLLMVALGSACEAQPANITVCTAIFAYVSVAVVDSNGAAVTGPFTVIDSVPRTGKFLTIEQQGYPAGSATVFSDNFNAEVSDTGDIVAVIGHGGGKTFNAVYQFATDGCHIRKISGPDTVVAR